MSFESLLKFFNTPYISLSLLVFIIICLSAYVKIATVLSVIRFGFGWYSIPTAFVTVIFSGVLSYLVMSPLLLEIEPQLQKLSKTKTDSGMTEEDRAAISLVESKWQKFLLLNTAEETLKNFQKASIQKPTKPSSADFSVLLAAFMVSQLSFAFKIAIVLLVPLIVIDIVVGISLTALNVTSVMPSMISTPLKIMLFVVVDGWSLIALNLTGSFS